MTPRTAWRGRHAALATAALTTALLPGLTQLTASASAAPPATAPAAAADPGPTPVPLITPGDAVGGLEDVDLRGTVKALAAQRDAVARLGVRDVRWNRFGTPSSLLPVDGSLGAAPGSPADAARAWLQGHAGVFGLTAADLSEANLELVESQELVGSKARAVLFRQRFDGLKPSIGSMVTVGVAEGKIAYVSSSLVRDPEAMPSVEAEPRMTPLEGWVTAAESVGANIPAVGDITSDVRKGWTRLKVPGLVQEQQARLGALAVADGTVRPVIEANVVNVAGGATSAYTVMVDAVSGEVLHRENQVENNNDAYPFQGQVTATECGPMHEFELTDGNTRQLVAAGLMANTLNDIEVRIFDPSGDLLASADTGTSPEVATYTAEEIPAGVYSAQVCPFADPTVPFLPPGDYALSVLSSDTTTPEGGGTGNTAEGSPRWRFFTANPNDNSVQGTPTNSVIGCWFTSREAAGDCTLPTGRLNNVAAPGPWDFLTNAQVPSFTTIGNNANTHEAWGNPLAPGGLAQAPVSPTQDYTDEFTDAWNNSGCNPAELTPGGNDILASVTNLFSVHNRMHDYSYYLGFDEGNYNMQLDNLGRGGVEGDQEIGNAQAGAITGGQPTYLGRDNANQITLQDGIPGITNQYLFQPIAGAFYAPCTDGGLDMGIVGHEYTHAISNRMVAGPDEGLTSNQGAAMGESWSDLVAAEYQFSHGYDNGGNIWAVGVYATGNEDVAIRDYAINRNPLNYSDYGFDTTGDEVHADGEIWNGTQWSVRQAIVDRLDARGGDYDYQNAGRQLLCAQATPDYALPPASCPGNRRWVQLIFDSFLLQQGATSMLDARDAMIAADRMRFGGQDVKVMWDAFARRGMGVGASVPDADSGDTTPSFASPTADNGRVTLRGGLPGRFYVGDYEARATPVADTLRGTRLDNTLSMAPGTYRMLHVSPKGGFQRFSLKVGAGQRVVRALGDRTNLASSAAGAEVIEASAGSLNADLLIDGTEATNWGGVTETNVDESRPYVSVDLAGGRSTVRRVQVSAMLTPAATGDDGLPLAQVDEDPDSGSRFTALRRFAIEACVRACDTDGATWKRVFTSKGDAFPGRQPRPVAPDLTMRSFAVPATTASALRLVTLENQCTGFAGYAGEQDEDPLNDTDCATASDRGTIVHASELQAFTR
ncbi:M36 family metallopeptidase [Nocardioides sp. AX2bis]|uniref:M36 family metallopeptidase n=1 Tax=Nocardioides sp. AX2bis TaxID=2653157 RepID=UPI0012F3FF90|nr:M36 family metallopeptidase [Nocardioides sp. AX2bis]VXB23001.1 Fungalysin metallopeptidase (M36) [Nocardioides sp. AX2bis]